MKWVQVLELSLYQEVVGYLIGFQGGKNVLTFHPSFRANSTRPTLGLITAPYFPSSERFLAKDWIHHQRLPPILSNLLPEGGLREWWGRLLGIHTEQEFSLFTSLCHDLPGALTARCLPESEVPHDLIERFLDKRSTFIEQDVGSQSIESKFSLAGVQMKFSMTLLQNRFSWIAEMLGDWIIKIPSLAYPYLPLNEYTCMRLAELAGLNVAQSELVSLSQLQGIPELFLTSQEQYAFATKRFDRTLVPKSSTNSVLRIHMEDFAQILNQYPYRKYNAANYEQIAIILKQYTKDPIVDLQEYVGRLLVNILLANGDAHLKNWSVLYPNRLQPELSPAYDIVMTAAYIAQEQSMALNLAKNKNWYICSFAHFEDWSKKVGVSWRQMRPHLNTVLEKARELWPQALQQAPMYDSHKKILRQHWQQLHPDFRIV